MHLIHICLKSQVFISISTTRMVRSAEELFGLRQQEDHRGAWSAVVDKEAVVAEAALGGRDGAAQRWAAMSLEL